MPIIPPAQESLTPESQYSESQPPETTQPEAAAASSEPVRKGEYSRRGEFHRNLNPNWSYYPIYVNKVEVVDEMLRRYHCEQGRTLDAGCGEGVLVEKYAEQGWDIIGVDKNYASAYVQEGSILEIPFEDNHFDTVMALDVLEHLNYYQQVPALKELKRVLKPGGILIFSCPNLAHFTGRLKLMFRGKLLRTATLGHHPGDRPMCEYEQLFKLEGFEILDLPDRAAHLPLCDSLSGQERRAGALPAQGAVPGQLELSGAVRLPFARRITLLSPRYQPFRETVF